MGEDVKKRRADKLSKEIPRLRNSLLSAMGNVHPTHMLDPKLRAVGESVAAAEEAAPSAAKVSLNVINPGATDAA